MMRGKSKSKNSSPKISSDGGESNVSPDLEVRPGGMLVQRRNNESDSSLVPIIRVRVKYQSIYHEVNIKSQATIGELKKMLTPPTGLHHQDQKLFFRGKERDSSAFLDVCGVKDRSKIVLMEDPLSQEKRFLEMRRSAKMEHASKSVSEISLEVDRLAGQVEALDSIISKGGKVVESDLTKLIELLMDQLLKLDSITADGDVKSQRKIQVKRVQKYVETLDMLKVKNSTLGNNGGRKPLLQHQEKLSDLQSPIQHGSVGKMKGLQLPLEQQQPARSSLSSSVVVTTKWETFDSTPAHASSSSPARLDWEFFD